MSANQFADAFAALWFNHEVMLLGVEKMTSRGPVSSPPTPVMASVEAQARTVTNAQGEEVTVAGTIKWSAEGPMPKVGDKLDLPPQFGMNPGREVITARLASTGTGLTPDHIEVTIK